MKTIIKTLCLLCFAAICFGQPTELDSVEIASILQEPNRVKSGQDIRILTKSTEEGIHFRWAPTNVTAWTMGLKYGYSLEKMAVTSDEFVPIEQSPFKTWEKQKWEPYGSEEYPYMLIAAQCIFGENAEESNFVDAANALSNRYTFNLFAADLDRRAAEASGLLYIDPNITEDNIAQYRIFSADPTSGQSTDTTYFVGGYYGIDKILAPQLSLQEEDGAIVLKWIGGGDPLANTGLTAYDIERSTDGQNYSKVNKQVFLNTTSRLMKGVNQTTFIDSVENNTKYYYRVKGVDPFGDWTEASNVVEGTASDKTPPTAPQLVSIEETDDKLMELTWTWSDEDNGRDLAGFNIYFSLSPEREFQKLNATPLAKGSRSYVHKEATIGNLNYYYIEAVDNASNGSISNVSGGNIVDDVPPAPPTNLRAEMDSTGTILLEWDAPADLDVVGYEVFLSNAKEYTFIKEAGDYIRNTYYVTSTTLNTLTKNLYYKVVAVDNNYNRSDYSEMIEVKRIDIIPPAASIFKDYRVKEKGIFFNWVYSTSNDVESVELFRRTKANPSWTKVETFDPAKDSFFDTDVDAGIVYEYNLITTDDSGNTSQPLSTLVLEALKPQILDDVQDVKLEKVDDKLILTWDYPDYANHRFMIYKLDNEGDFTMIKKLEGQTSMTMGYNEKAINTYAVRVKGPDGRKSRMSDAVNLEQQD